MKKHLAAARSECIDECQSLMGGRTVKSYLQEHQHRVTQEFSEAYSKRDVRFHQQP